MLGNICAEEGIQEGRVSLGLIWDHFYEYLRLNAQRKNCANAGPYNWFAYPNNLGAGLPPSGQISLTFSFLQCSILPGTDHKLDKG